MVLRPILDAFLDADPTVSAKLLLFDRAVNLIEDGFDVALRIGPLADSAMVAIPPRRCAPGRGRLSALFEAASTHRRAR
jgi:DNA-binding transcriptional LysR family regulator